MEFWKTVWDSILLFVIHVVSFLLSGSGAIYVIESIAELEHSVLLVIALTLGLIRVLKGIIVILTGYLNELLNKTTAGRKREKWYTQISDYMP